MGGKKAKVVPVFKKGDRVTLNYRPVSLTSVICSLLIVIIRKQIKHECNGCRGKRSRVTKL